MKKMLFKMSREDKVAAFLRAAGKKPFDKKVGDIDESVFNAVDEEIDELQEAAWVYAINPNESNRAYLCKEWADAQYVLSQMAWYFDIPADPSFNRVHLNNMTKIGPDGKVKFRDDGKILKPDDYKPADMSGL